MTGPQHMTEARILLERCADESTIPEQRTALAAAAAAHAQVAAVCLEIDLHSVYPDEKATSINRSWQTAVGR